MKLLLRFFFRLLYHQLAFSYDLVAATVSLNRWKNWVVSVIPFVEGNRILEIGHGPGHLQSALHSRGFVPVGIDESAQMGRLAQNNLARSLRSRREALPEEHRSADRQAVLTRGIAQQLPFPPLTFHTIVATFPTEYITDPRALAEIKRCLLTGGRLVVLPVALPRNRFLDWLFKVTRQRPLEALEVIQSRLQEPFIAAGFQTEIKTLGVDSGILLVIVAIKP